MKTAEDTVSRARAIDRTILWLALAGMVLAVHLWVQKARGFDQGCLGLGKPVAAAAAGCREVGDLPASHLFGISNAAWGYAFYFTLAALALGQWTVGERWGRRFRRMGWVLSTAGFLYSLYLVYQMAFVAHAWCVLCTVSAGLTTALFGLASLRERGEPPAADEAERAAEFRAGMAACFVAAGVLVGVLVFVNRLGTRSLLAGDSRREMEQLVGASLPLFIDSDKLQEMRACRFDPSAPMLDWAKLDAAELPFDGKEGAVEVVIFYDPNCPHCRDFHPEFRRLMARLGDRARFTIAARTLWNQSLPQAAALQLAAASGKYFELWDAMFAHQAGPQKSMPVAQIAALFRDLGLDDANLESRLLEASPKARALTDRARAAGIDGTPALYIGGRRVWWANHGEDCVEKLIERRTRQIAAERGAK